MKVLKLSCQELYDRIRQIGSKTEAWQHRKEQAIIYLGEGVSGGLNYSECNQERLRSLKLPAFSTIEEIAKAIGITLGQIRFFAFK